jgi:hypothetical protein
LELGLLFETKPEASALGFFYCNVNRAHPDTAANKVHRFGRNAGFIRQGIQSRGPAAA